MDQEAIKKKLLYRSCYRGCRETDFLIGNYARQNFDKITDTKLYSQFLEESDNNIYNWIMNKDRTPNRYQYLVNNIKKFHNID